MSEHSPQALRAEALESLLIEQGLLTEAEVDETLALFNDRGGTAEWCACGGEGLV